ncbi:MAG: STAS domain-containing protein [Pseudomonadota bacterium]
MTIPSENTGSTLIVRPTGRIDYSASAAFQADLESVVSQAQSAGLGLVVNCAGIDYISSAGLRAFLVAARSAKSAPVKLALCGVNPNVKEVFDVSGLTRLITVVGTEAEAVAKVAS